MPNRILREGILTSERVNALSWEAEVFYRRLMSVVDDYGRYTAHPSLLRAALYPLKLETVRDANLERLLASVVQARLVRVYEVDGKRYLEMLDFRQQVRAKDSKFPAPAEHEAGAGSSSAQQMRSTCAADAPVFGDGGGGGDDTPRAARGAAGGGPVDPVEGQAGTPAGRMCAALKAVGIARTNPGHPMLGMLLAAGATEAEFLGAAPQALGKRDPFAYLLQVVKGQREAAAAAATQVHAGPLPAKQVTVASDDADKTKAYLDGLKMTDEQREAARVARQRALRTRRQPASAAVGDSCA